MTKSSVKSGAPRVLAAILALLCLLLLCPLPARAAFNSITVQDTGWAAPVALSPGSYVLPDGTL